jgi:hypothetical protein
MAGATAGNSRNMLYKKHPRRLRSPDCAHELRIGSRSCMRSESTMTLYFVRATHGGVRYKGNREDSNPTEFHFGPSGGKADKRR